MRSPRAAGIRCSTFVIIASCVLFLTQAAGYDGGPVRVCVPAQQSPAQLANCTNALGRANTSDVQFTCVAGGSIFGVGSLMAMRILSKQHLRACIAMQCNQTDNGVGMNATSNLQKKLQFILPFVVRSASDRWLMRRRMLSLQPVSKLLRPTWTTASYLSSGRACLAAITFPTITALLS